jgi:hypothetical protein
MNLPPTSPRWGSALAIPTVSRLFILIILMFGAKPEAANHHQDDYHDRYHYYYYQDYNVAREEREIALDALIIETEQLFFALGVRVAVLALDFGASGTDLLVGAVALRTAAGSILAILVCHAFFIALNEGHALVPIAAGCHALEIEVAIVLIQLLALQTGRWLNAIVGAAAQCRMAIIIIFA